MLKVLNKYVPLTRNVFHHHQNTNRFKSSKSWKWRRSTPPEPPTDCCMSNCPNCVWVQYADELVAYYKDGGAKARKELDRLVTDPTMKMFINMELKSKFEK